MVEITRLNKKDADTYFIVLLPFIEKALEHSEGEYDLVDVEHGLLSGRYESWIAVADDEVKAVAITEVVQHPNYRELLIKHIGGKDKNIWMTPEWQDRTFSQYAKDTGCKNLVMFGRKGWKRVLDKLGWKESYTIMKKEI